MSTATLLTVALVIVAVALGVAGYRYLSRNKREKVAATSPVSSADPDKYTDGPYITYAEDQIIVHQVRIHDGKPTPIRNSLPRTERRSLTFSCQTDDPNPFTFRFTLKERLAIAPTEYDTPVRLLAVSDIEGNFRALYGLLLGNRVIDRSGRWVFGRGHLVVLGDVFDRATNVLPCLWLIYQLEQEATTNGGQVHFILGNHEEMNLRGDERFLPAKYQRLARELGVRYHELFSNYTELGQWLRTKNAVEKIGDALYVHGGISYLVEDSGLTLKEINRIVRRHIGSEDLLEQEGELMLGNDGPLWYRGYFGDLVTPRHLDQVRRTYGVRRIVVGHTVVPEIMSLYERRLYAIDVAQPTQASDGLAQGLWMERNTFFVTNEKGLRRNVPTQKMVPSR